MSAALRARVAGLAAGRGLLVLVFILTLPLVTPRIRGADEIEYFSYLRSLVFDGDLEFGNEYTWFYERDPQGLAGFKATFLDLREPSGRHINFAPLGSALLWSPFYLAAHAGVVAARALGASVAADGFSLPYELAVCFASALYGFLGLLLIHDALRRWGGFPEPAAGWTVVALWLGTPVLYYLTVAPAFSHACSLFVVAGLLWLWLRARSQATTSPLAWALVGATGGLAGLVREQDALYLVIPGLDLAWRTVTRREWRLGLVGLVALGGAAFVLFMPQFLAYHAINGTFKPTTLVTRKMTWTSPHFFEVLLDPGHGLFVWSPLVLVGVVGLVVLVARRRRGALPLWLLSGFLFQVWINGAVESWSLAGAFGSRRFISATALVAWGLCALVASALTASRRRVRRLGVALTLAACVWWNLSLMVQFGLRLMDRQGLDWPRVAISQVTEVPPRLARTAYLFVTDRERLVRESR